MATAIRPLGNRVLVKTIENKESTTRSGIVIPDTAKEKPQEAEVIAVGPGERTEKGERLPIDVKAGDRVLYAKYAGSEFKIDDIEYLVLAEKDILAVVNSNGS